MVEYTFVVVRAGQRKVTPGDEVKITITGAGSKDEAKAMARQELAPGERLACDVREGRA